MSLSETMGDTVDCDVLVVGSGAAGWSTALSAAKGGLKVIIAEKEPVFGGTTAFSGGWMWIPGNPIEKRAGITDSVEAGRTYIQHEAGNFFDADRVDSFLENGPRMVEFMEREIDFKFVHNMLPDYHVDSPGATRGGRPIASADFDGRQCKPWIKYMRPPMPESTVFGISIGAASGELQYFMRAASEFKSAMYVAKRIAIYYRDVLVHGQDMRLCNGQALVAQLAHGAFSAGVQLWLNSAVTKLTTTQGRVTGAVIDQFGREIEVRARRGVVLAGGGFPHDRERMQQLHAHRPGPNGHYSAAPHTNIGLGLRLAESVGGVVEAYAGTAALYPVSRVPQKDGSFRTYPHHVDRSRPGMIAVLPSGRRFTNESASYDDTITDLIKSGEPGKDIRCYFIADHRFMKRWGLGQARPGFPMGPHIGSGYLKRADTIEQLAVQIDINPGALMRTISVFNQHAKEGKDPEFGRGSNFYNRYIGDPDVKPNEALRALNSPPYYAVEIRPGDLGTFAGVASDGKARVLNAQRQPIPGLHVVGNDMASVFGGKYIAGGCTLGPAVTFGYIAGQYLAAQ